MLRTTLARSLRTASRPSVLAAVVRPASFAPLPSAARSISSSTPRLDVTPLSAKLTEELQFELESAPAEEEPEFLKEFKSEGTWAIDDVAGADEIVLTRTYGKESIRIVFSISDIDAEVDEPIAAGETPFAGEESADLGSGGVGDENLAPGEEAAADSSFPVEAAITVTKPGQGAMTIDAVAQDGYFQINNISYYPDADLAVGTTSEDDWRRQGLYVGPDFGNLDEGVQAEFENYLEERGINANLALTIPDLAEYKEQKEYVAWLQSVKSFIES